MPDFGSNFSILIAHADIAGLRGGLRGQTRIEVKVVIPVWRSITIGKAREEKTCGHRHTLVGSEFQRGHKLDRDRYPVRCHPVWSSFA